MLDDQANELRRIRITLIVLVIVLIFKSGDSTVSYDFPQYQDVNVTGEKIIQFNDERFGILYEHNYMEIFEYDAETNEMRRIKNVNLDEL